MIENVISRTIQLLFIMIVGFYARKRKFIDRANVQALARLLSNITNPLLIICSFQMPFDAHIMSTGLTIFAGGVVIHLVTAVICYFVFRSKTNPKDNVVYELNTLFANCGFMGFPILAAIYGDKLGIMYGAFYNTVFNLCFWSYGIAMLSRHERSGKKQKLDFKKLFLNPGIIATVFGFILFICEVKIPDALLGGMDMVGDATFPLAMIIIGALIVELDLKTAFKDLKLYICLFLKLLAFPLATLGICLLCGASTIVTQVLVVLSGMPSATLGAVFAEIYGTNPINAAKLVCITTVISVGTIPLLLYITNLFI
ncbi:MAG: AEC family transporter [Clostridia bacterium]|nr:AEC family transporter [Clostridia bacterium]